MAIANNTTNLTNQDLSIQINLNGLSFCILDQDTQTITFLKHITLEKKTTPIQILDKLKHCFNSIDELNNTFNKVTVIYINDLATLVPKEFFNEELLADYLKFNSKILKSDFIAYDTVTANNSMNVYVPYVNINNYIYDKFGSFSYKHYATILLEQILKNDTLSQEENMYVNVGDTHFEIIVVNSGKLKFYNTFEYHSQEDFIYYILFTIEQLSLNPEKINLILLGNIVKNDDLYNITYKYIRHVSFGHRKDTYNYIETPKSNHSHFTLIHSFS
ncbi:DUF3822 family protein [Mangrovimonas cancribranchiae]|uniref:DUF3822 family protein n=1 Tax=Mangrovimonas cancribranchiae TaxID=3080055 RepID=A0AAU6NZG7_9FLAO